MGTVVNTFEGGTNGTTVTTANSGGGSGNAFNTVTLDSNTIIYDSAHAQKGALSLKVSCGVTSGSPVVLWNAGFSGTTMYMRTYVLITANPAANQNVLRLRVGTTIVGTVRINTTGRIQNMYGTGTAGATSTNALTLGSWARIETVITTSTTTTGQMVTRLYLTPDATTPTETISNTGISTGNAGAITQFLAGMVSSTTNWDIWFDDMAVSTSGWLGPSTANLARYFPDNSYIDFNTGAASSNDGGAITLAFMARFDDVTNGGLHSGLDSGAALIFCTELFNSGDFYYSASGDALWATAATSWVGYWALIVVTKANGAATARYHRYLWDSSPAWTHTDASGTVSDSAATIGASGTLRVGRWSSSVEYIWGAVELDAVWNSALSDAQVEGLLTWSNWSSADVLHRYNQALTTTSVADLSTAGTSTQKAITGTTITTGNPAFTYSGSGAAITPAVISRTSTVLAATVSAETSATVTPAVISRTSAVLAAAVTSSATTAPAVISRTSAVLAADVSTGTTVAPAVIARTSTVHTPDLVQDATVTADVITRASTVLGGAVTSAAEATPTVIARTSAVLSATVGGGAGVAPAAISRTSAVLAADVSTGTTVTPAVIVRSSLVHSPDVSAGGSASVTADVISRASAIYGPAVTSSATATPGVIARTSSVHAVAVTSAAAVTPASIARTSAVAAPTVTAVANASITPAVIARTSEVPVPGVSAGGSATVVADVIVRTSTVLTPSVAGQQQASVTPDVIARTSAVAAPTVTAGSAAQADPATITRTSAVLAPTVETGSTVLVTVISRSGTVLGPTVAVDVGATVTPAVIVRSGAVHPVQVTVPEADVPYSPHSIYAVRGTATVYAVRGTATVTRSP